AGISPRWKPAKRSEDTSENRKGKFEFRNSNFEIPLIPGFPCRFLWLARGDDERYWRASLHGGGRRSDQKTPRKIGKGNSNFEIRISQFPLSQASLSVSFGSLVHHLVIVVVRNRGKNITSQTSESQPCRSH